MKENKNRKPREQAGEPGGAAPPKPRKGPSRRNFLASTAGLILAGKAVGQDAPAPQAPAPIKRKGPGEDLHVALIG